MFKAHVGNHGAYALYFFGQTIAAVAQPMFNSLPASLAAAWFPVNERDIAITIAALFNPLGNAVGQVLPPMFVTENSDGTVSGFQSLMVCEAIVIGLSFVVTFCLFKSEPPSPPSHSTKLKNMVQ